jgi:quercetin dioxygenase-like cupin family protein
MTPDAKTPDAFTADLASAGFTHIETRDLPPRPANERHAHAWRTRGLVLSGVFTLITDTGPTAYRAGEIFDVPAGVAHAEEIGAEGARILLGRQL